MVKKLATIRHFNTTAVFIVARGGRAAYFTCEEYDNIKKYIHNIFNYC